MFSKAATFATLLSTVTAHQNFHQFWVNDISPGYQVAIRMPPSNSPVTDVTSDDISCNVNGNVVPTTVGTATANEGDTIKVQWDSSSHPGPITHMLFGPVGNASTATGIGSWVKIDEFDSENGTWANAIMEAQNMTYSFNLPTGLASGDYLLRSEMLALHGSQTLGGGQFYIGCAQLTITGTGGGSCSPSIQLPGAYNENDTDIYIPNFYNGFDISTYTAPGGPVATCGTGSGSGSSVVATPAAATPTFKVTSAAASSVTSVITKPTSQTQAYVESSISIANSAIETNTGLPTTSAIATAISSKSKTACKAKTTLKTVASGVASTIGATRNSTSSGSSGTVAKYGQCGGTGFTGSTTCASGSTCTIQNPYYSQCI
ncbi:glycosyl hydrolase family 61-domain-containing protein [Tricladium varicosporioides]|nr:glycosyl hydrolase family 61-domain-containing protein [Hymenoscyphus varicosporioides]